jgi:ribose transport system ATP-binding protein
VADRSHPAPLLAVRGIFKRFPGVTALQDVSLHVQAGEVLALMGENGAGKSTLMKILAGAEQPDHGTISVDSQPAVIDCVHAAKSLGIAFIHQELMLAPNLDIAANIFLGNEQSRGLWRRLPRAKLSQRARALLARVGLRHSPDTRLAALSTGQRQLVEIAKALSVDARLVIMDEPTSSLTAGESETLFAIIAQLRAQGIAVIYISHRMNEVLRLADRVVVLRDGRLAGELRRDELSVDKIVQLMVGRELSGQYFPQPRTAAWAAGAAAPTDHCALEVRDLVVEGTARSVSFNARRGEILGFAGLVGSGRTELMEAIFGTRRCLTGRMLLGGRPFAPGNTRDAIRHGVFLAPEDRKHHGLVLNMAVVQNLSLPCIAGFGRFGWLNRRAENRLAETQVARLRIRTPGIRQAVVNLSGGNQQKVVLGKWLAMNPQVLILDEPTRGIDVGAKAEIYQHMTSLCAQGLTILMVSSELEEIIGMSDRVIVMHERRISGVLVRAQTTPERIGLLMAGQAA